MEKNYSVKQGKLLVKSAITQISKGITPNCIILGSPAGKFILTPGFRGCYAGSCKTAVPSPLRSTLSADQLQVPEEQEITESSETPGLSSVFPYSPGKKHKL